MPLHVAFEARSREQVQAFHEAALAAGGKNNGDPGYRDYWPGYYLPLCSILTAITSKRCGTTTAKRRDLVSSALRNHPVSAPALRSPGCAGRRAVDSLIHKGYLCELADAYLGAAADREDPRVSPLFANLTGMPPMLIQVGSAETLLDDATRLAAAAGQADVPVTLEIWPHMIHAMASVECPFGVRPTSPEQRGQLHARTPVRDGSVC